MSNSFDPTQGKTLVIEFTRNGKMHKSVRWCSDPTLLEDLLESGNALERIKSRYARHGAEVFKIAKIESTEICCS